MIRGNLVGVTVAACLAVLPLPALASPTINAQTAPGVNFGAYKTYAWTPQMDAQANPTIYVAIISDVDSVMSQNGYQRVDSNGDMSLVLTIGSHVKSDVETWGWWGQQLADYEYTVGQVAIDALDTNTQQPLWHGYASETVDTDNPDMNRINEAVYELITQFPPSTGIDSTVPMEVVVPPTTPQQ
jgi:hypothetical protein